MTSTVWIIGGQMFWASLVHSTQYLAESKDDVDRLFNPNKNSTFDVESV